MYKGAEQRGKKGREGSGKTTAQTIGASRRI